jgi:hypothetical protein
MAAPAEEVPARAQQPVDVDLCLTPSCSFFANASPLWRAEVKKEFHGYCCRQCKKKDGANHGSLCQRVEPETELEEGGHIEFAATIGHYAQTNSGMDVDDSSEYRLPFVSAGVFPESLVAPLSHIQLTGEWKDQGWGNEKGRLRVRVLSPEQGADGADEAIRRLEVPQWGQEARLRDWAEGEDEPPVHVEEDGAGWVWTSPGRAHHEWSKFDFTLDRDDEVSAPLFRDVTRGHFLYVSVWCGSGNGHAIEMKDVTLKWRTMGGLMTKAARKAD